MDEFFQRMDRDYDGRLSFEEFMGEESQIEKLFKNMDKNGDGFVTKQAGSLRILVYVISLATFLHSIYIFLFLDSAD